MQVKRYYIAEVKVYASRQQFDEGPVAIVRFILSGNGQILKEDPRSSDEILEAAMNSGRESAYCTSYTISGGKWVYGTLKECERRVGIKFPDAKHIESDVVAIIREVV